MTTLVWFRDDLRTTDNAALAWAAERGNVVGIVVDESVGRPLGAAARWWRNKSVHRLGEKLPLIRAQGDPRFIIPEVARELGAQVTWNRRYYSTDIDAQIKESTDAVSHPGFLLTEPFEIATGSGTPFKVFTPFSKAVQARLLDTPPVPATTPSITPADVDVDALSDWAAEPEPFWAENTLAKHCEPGEDAALRRLEEFLASGGYDNDDLGAGATSGLSPYLRFGEISPATVWAAAVEHPHTAGFLRQLIWRDFAWHRYFYVEHLETRNVRGQFDRFEWAWTPHAVPGTDKRAFAHPDMDPNADHLEHLGTWQRGETGVPLVDAGMRELWATGTMHNRARMVTGSWLTKNLGIHWRHGEEWFWDTLVDADVASNPFNWQWVAGSGDDAAPYFRIFNPVLQQEKFDPDASYVTRWVPGAFTPLYPEPMVDIKESRKTALAAYEDMRSGL